MEPQTTQFEGWAVVELFGHAKEIGFVSTRYFGTACLFQIDVPELPEREILSKAAEWVEHEGRTILAPEGSKMKRPGSPARTRLVGPGAVYSMTPCTEETARVAIERAIPRALVLLELGKKADAPQVQWPETDAETEEEEEETLSDS
jgi:hypothetical protein